MFDKKTMAAIAKGREIEKMTPSQLADYKDAEARKRASKSDLAKLDKLRAMMDQERKEMQERKARQSQQGRYEGDTGDMNSGKTAGDIYTHSRKR